MSSTFMILEKFSAAPKQSRANSLARKTTMENNVWINLFKEVMPNLPSQTLTRQFHFETTTAKAISHFSHTLQPIDMTHRKRFKILKLGIDVINFQSFKNSPLANNNLKKNSLAKKATRKQCLDQSFQRSEAKFQKLKGCCLCLLRSILCCTYF